MLQYLGLDKVSNVDDLSVSDDNGDSNIDDFMNNRKKITLDGDKIPLIAVPGRIFPVDEFYLEDVLETTRWTFDEESEFVKYDFKNRIGWNVSTVTTKSVGGGTETHVSYWDDEFDL